MARAARQSSKSGLSRSVNPARNGPRARRGGAWRGRRVSVDGASRSSSCEVDPDRVAVELDLRPVDAQRAVADGRPQRRQRPAEGAAGRRVVGLRPEERRQLVAGVGPPSAASTREDRHGLAGVDDERRPVDEDLGRAQQADVERRRRLVAHDVTVPIPTAIP